MMFKNFIDKISYSSIDFLSWLLKKINVKISKKIINFIAVNIGYRIGIRKELVLKQMKRSLPNLTSNEILSITKKMYSHYGDMVHEIFCIGINNIIPSIKVVGEEYLQEAIDCDKAVIVATGHFGNWELGAIATAHKTNRMSAIAKKQKNAKFDDLINNNRTALGLNMIYSRYAMRGIVKAIKKKHFLYILHDQDARKNGEIIPFLNHDASVFMGVARIALKFDLPILCQYQYKNTQGENVIEYEKIFYPKKEKLDDIQTMKRVIKSLERMIKKYPQEWFWVHKRWKSVEKKYRNSHINND